MLKTNLLAMQELLLQAPSPMLASAFTVIIVITTSTTIIIPFLPVPFAACPLVWLCMQG